VVFPICCNPMQMREMSVTNAARPTRMKTVHNGVLSLPTVYAISRDLTIIACPRV
jgi:hypothetical protein